MPKSVSLILPDGVRRQVGRLEVAVDDAAVVGVFERRRHLQRQVQHVGPGQLALLGQQRLVALALDEFHRVVIMALLFAGLEEADDVGMVELAQDVDFALETGEEAGVGGQFRRQYLDGGDLRAFAVGLGVGVIDRRPCRRGRVPSR